MKKVLKFLFLSLCAYVSAQAQTPGAPIGGVVVKGGKNPGGDMLINVGGGISNPSSDTKKNQLLGSGSSFNAGFYLPVFSFGPDGNFTFGPNISATYSKFNGDVAVSPKYNITGQSAPPTGSKSANGNSSGFTAEAGLHANLSFGKITISPVLNAGYLNFKQDGFKVKQSNQVNGKTYSFDLVDQKDIKESGVTLIPKLRVGYFPGKLGLYLETNYVLGPEISTSQSTLQPLGNGNNIDGSYQLDQLMAGKQITSERATPFKNSSFNFGVIYAFGEALRPARKQARAVARKKAKVANSIKEENPTEQPQNQSIVSTTRSNTKDRVAADPSVTGGTNPTNKPQNQSIINTTKSNTKDRVATDPAVTGGTNPSGQPQNQSIVSSTRSNTKDRVAADPGLTEGNINQPSIARPGEPIGGIIVKGGRNPGGQMRLTSNSQGEFTFTNAEAADFKFSIEIPKTTAGNGNTARPGQPIGGIIVKGGRNPGGQMFTTTATSNGEVAFKNLPAGNYMFTITAPTGTKEYENFRKGWDGTVKGGSKNSVDKVKNPLFEENENSGINPIFEFSNAARPGEPIGGIIVKGGRNPGGQMRLTSNSQGEFTFTNAEAADFKFSIEIPKTTAGNGNTARPGQPIGGIIVKGGRNPGGQMFTTTATSNGEVAFKNLPAGNYKFILTAPTGTKEYENFRKGWDGTVKGGSK